VRACLDGLHGRPDVGMAGKKNKEALNLAD
jgi:hypothetical protein